ncbi:MAG: SLBB domain-containing protein [Spirochaetaceae bacterium]|jgi:electron transport complex protein RnfC|nr:SLBB domain-containing protein [Spirochaetaceae bacterium]
MKAYKFPRGGIPFGDATVPPKTGSSIAFLPVLSVMPLVQHTGAKASPVVEIGDQVREGMLIGRGQGPGSANIHAPVPGAVMRTVSWQPEEGMQSEALVIRLGGGFEKLGKPEKIFHWEDLKPFALQQIIAEYGIVEMEGSGAPLADILGPVYSRDPETLTTLVVRCVFDDPWLAADYVLCQERLKAVAEGSVILCQSAQINRIVYAVSDKDYELGTKLLEEAGRYRVAASLAPVGSRYPQKNRRELELVLRTYEKREGLELGSFLILGPATLAAVHDAVKLKKPILERYIAVGGSAVKRPAVMRVRLGARLRDVFAECGGFTGEPQRVIIGSPLRGRRVTDLDEPVIKTSYAAVALLEAQIGGTVMRNCIGCGECRQVCPVGLDPEALFKSAVHLPAEPVPEIAAECHACGCCSVACPSRLPLSVVIQSAAQRN